MAAVSPTVKIETLISARDWVAMECDGPNVGVRKSCPGFIVSLGTFSEQSGQGSR